MSKLLYLGLASLLIQSSLSAEPQTNEQILQKMVSNAIDATLEQYHKDDWRQIRDIAAHFWRDPSSPLEQEVTTRINHFHQFLWATLLNNKKAALVILSQYFEYQLDCLQIDYANAPKSRLHVWSNTPPQYHATLAFEVVAGNLGIKLNKDYHHDYAQASERARLVEDQQRRIEAELAKAIIPPPPPPVAPPPYLIPAAPLAPKAPNNFINTAPLKSEKKDIGLIQLRGPIGEQKVPPKLTKSGTSSLTPDVLSEIKKGSIKLKPVADRLLKDKPLYQDSDLRDVLARRLQEMRRSIKGED